MARFLIVAVLVMGQDSGSGNKCQPRTWLRTGSVKLITVQPTWPGGLTETRGMITEQVQLRCTKNLPTSSIGCSYQWRVWFERSESYPPMPATQVKALGAACSTERKENLITVGNFRIEPSGRYIARSNIYAGNSSNVGIGIPLDEATFYFRGTDATTVLTPPLVPPVPNPKYPGQGY